MKQVLLSFVLIFSAFWVYGQGKPGASPSAPAAAITYNNKQPINPDQAAFPIDRPFNLEIDSIPTNNIIHVYVFEIKSRKGVSTLYDSKIDYLHPNKNFFRASFEILAQNIFIGENMIILPFPALRAEKEFDISIVREFSPVNLTKALYLNKLLDSQYYQISVKRAGPGSAIAYSKTLDSLLKDLLSAVNDKSKYHNKGWNELIAKKNGIAYRPAEKDIPIDSIATYNQFFYDPVKADYQKLVGTAPKYFLQKDTAKARSLYNDFFWHTSFLNQKQVNDIAQPVTKTAPFRSRMYILQKLEDDSLLFKAVLTGNKPIDGKALTTATDPFDFAARIRNINSARSFLDSLNNALINLKPAKGNQVDTNYNGLIAQINFYETILEHNAKFINGHFKTITDKVLLNSTENIWVTGQSDKSTDLATLSYRVFAINAGAATIFANDNSGKLNCIVKPFLGIDFHFKAYDKNADFNQILPVPDANKSLSHSLEAKPSFLYRFSFTAGFAFGSMTNKDFTNAYGSFSFMAGPSYLLGKYVKLSMGVATIGRYNNNPVLASNSNWLLCPYASLSVDYDLLSVVQNVTNSLFK